MIRALSNLLYDSTAAEFKSDFGLGESVARLQAATRRFAFGVLTRQAATGPVSEQRVQLQRVIPMVSNSFKPFFFGRFEARGQDVYLVGRFTMHWAVKAFMTFWLGGVLAIGLTFAIAAKAAPGGHGPAVLGVLGMFAFGIALVALGKWFARNDIGWLSNVIRASLTDTPQVSSALPSPAVASTPAFTSSVPTVLRVAALVLLVSGALSLWSAISGISSWQMDGTGEVIERFASPLPRLAVGALGVFLVALAPGIYRRQLWAWWLALGLLAAATVWTVVQAFTGPLDAGGIVFKVIFAVLTVAVAIYWCWWWYAQRVHFESADPQ